MITQAFYVAIVVVVAFNLMFRVPLAIVEKRDRNQGGRLISLASFHIGCLISCGQRLVEQSPLLTFTGGLPFLLVGALLSTYFLPSHGTKR